MAEQLNLSMLASSTHAKLLPTTRRVLATPEVRPSAGARNVPHFVTAGRAGRRAVVTIGGKGKQCLLIGIGQQSKPPMLQAPDPKHRE
ncbi:hypothetical protein [Accumulibacter sp.]|uniref:hypothetical protein n=1 Tax=Accumulibacter sp. TaxID=2053492 RepID=UPI00263014DC|nr:hypothetical protein [Accumulibacter sp.]